MFAGLISKEQPVSAWGDAEKIMAALAPYSLDKPRDYWSTDKQMLLQVATRTGSTAAEIYHHAESGIAVAFWGRLDNCPDLISQLEAEHKASDDELVALAWLKWGEFCPEKLIGDYAFAVASPKTGVLFLARDVMGVKPLYYRADANGIFFASTAAAFKPLQLGSLTRSQKWMAEYMLELSYSHTDTAYEEIKKLPGAHSLLIHADGRANVRRYHRFVDDASVEKKRDPKYLEAYRAAWQEAVACRMPATGNIGTENSGGLDSGSITAELARQLGGDKDRLHGFGFCLEPLEPEYISETALKCSLKNNFLLTNPDDEHYKTMQEREVAVCGYPNEHPNAVQHEPIYMQCQNHSIGTLFSGFGGDEAVTNEASPATTEFVMQRSYAALWNVIPGNFPRRVVRFARALRTLRHEPEFNDYTLKIWQERWDSYFLTDYCIDRYDLRNRYFEMAKFSEQHQSVNAYVMWLIGQSYHSTRLDTCTLLASSYGVDYAWPLWDQRLVQCWLSTPAIWKIGPGGISRYLHRMAVDGVCAPKVAWKATKDMGYSSTKDKLENISLKPWFEELENSVNNLPFQLKKIVDVKKAEAISELGIAKNKKGIEQYFAVKCSVQYLSDLINWVI